MVRLSRLYLYDSIFHFEACIVLIILSMFGINMDAKRLKNWNDLIIKSSSMILMTKRRLFLGIAK